MITAVAWLLLFNAILNKMIQAWLIFRICYLWPDRIGLAISCGMGCRRPNRVSVGDFSVVIARCSDENNNNILFITRLSLCSYQCKLWGCATIITIT